MILKVLIASALGSVVWGLLALVSRLTKKRFSSTWHYYASLIPIFFMLGGTYLFTPIFSFITSRFNITPIVLDTTNILPINTEVLLQKSLGNASPKGFDIDTILLIVTGIWAIGVLMFLAVRTFDFHIFKQKVLKSAVESEIKLRKVRIVKSPLAGSPILIGLFTPIIVLPIMEMTAEEQSVILTHELIHKKRGDLWIKFLVLIVGALHWFNPLTYKISDGINAFCEASCDEKVVETLSTQGRKQYGNTILNVLKNGTQCNSAYYTGLATVSDKEKLKGRLQNIMEFRKEKKIVIIVSIGVATTLLIVGAIIAFSMGVGQPNTKPIPVVGNISTTSDTNGIQNPPSGLPELETDSITSTPPVYTDEEKQSLYISDDAKTGDDSEFAIMFFDKGEQQWKRGTSDVTIENIDRNTTIVTASPLPEDVAIYLSCDYGTRGHMGVDVTAEKGTEIYAVADGTVVSSNVSGAFGNLVVIDHGNGVITRYAHCSKLNVKKGDIVTKGELIANVGSTGRATGDHLHLELEIDEKTVDPKAYIPI